jgi:hypothetical protein
VVVPPADDVAHANVRHARVPLVQSVSPRRVPGRAGERPPQYRPLSPVRVYSHRGIDA